MEIACHCVDKGISRKARSSLLKKTIKNCKSLDIPVTFQSTQSIFKQGPHGKVYYMRVFKEKSRLMLQYIFMSLTLSTFIV